MALTTIKIRLRQAFAYILLASCQSFRLHGCHTLCFARLTPCFKACASRWRKRSSRPPVGFLLEDLNSARDTFV